MKRKIVEIDEKKCNGCGLCAKACHEGAIEMIDGKAKLVSDSYCDGLGDCLPECPTGAIEIVEREAGDYDEEAVEKRKAERNNKQEGHGGGCPGTRAKMIERKNENKSEPLPCGCPGTAAKSIERKPSEKVEYEKEAAKNETTSVSELMQWPVQIKLINTKAPYLNGANLLIAADCTAYAYANFHRDFIKGHITMIGCPKLDDNNYYKEKFAEILKNNNIKSITVVRMEVPCCGGMVSSVKSAMLEAQTIVPYREVVIGTDGSIIE